MTTVATHAPVTDPSSSPRGGFFPSIDPGDVVRALYAAVEAGDVPALAALLADDVVFHVPGRSPNAGTYRGRGEVLAFLGKTAAATGGTMRTEVSEVAVGRDHVLALARYTARKGEHALENRLCHVLRVEDGRIVESRFFTGDQYAVDAFWSA